MRPEASRDKVVEIMRNKTLEKIIFSGTSQLTRYFPKWGARALDAIIQPLCTHFLLVQAFQRKNQSILKKLQKCERFLIIPDSLIGDTVQMQSSITAVRDFFPNAQIDYLTNQFAYPLVEKNTDATHMHPLFLGKSFPTEKDIQWIRELIQKERYDLCFNLSPFIMDKELGAPQQLVINFMTHTPVFIQNERHFSQINHYTYQCYEFIRGLLSEIGNPVRSEKMRGVSTYYSDSILNEAMTLIQSLRFCSTKPVILFNPDTASPYTMLPFDNAVQLVSELVQLDAVVWIGAGHTIAGLGNQLRKALSPALRERVFILPPVSLSVFSVLIDFSDVLVTGDTAPMHIAASRKIALSSHYSMRNRTAIFSIFGATISRLSGYDSLQPGYLAAFQDAPSWCYPVSSPCRNLSCLNKMFKTCTKVRCFEDFKVKKVIHPIQDYIHNLKQTDVNIHATKKADDC